MDFRARRPPEGSVVLPEPTTVRFRMDVVGTPRAVEISVVRASVVIVPSAAGKVTHSAYFAVTQMRPTRHTRLHNNKHEEHQVTSHAPVAAYLSCLGWQWRWRRKPLQYTGWCHHTHHSCRPQPVACSTHPREEAGLDSIHHQCPPGKAHRVARGCRVRPYLQCFREGGRGLLE